MLVNILNDCNTISTAIAITAGETVALALAISVAGAPLNLTGYSFKSQIDFSPPLLLNTTNGGITITDAAQGQAQVNISSATTAAVPAGPYPYDLWMVSPNGAETPLLRGSYLVTLNITPVP